MMLLTPLVTPFFPKNFKGLQPGYVLTVAGNIHNKFEVCSHFEAIAI